MVTAEEIGQIQVFAGLEAIDVHNAATGETTWLESSGLFIFIGADAETVTGSDVRAAGRREKA